jgi:hypothetical protein
MTATPPERRRGAARPWRAAALCGLLAAAAYLAGALASAALDPLQRRPLLDGLAPRTPYRWVAPPPELAASNKPPSGGSFKAKLTASGSQVGAFSTQDTQVTLILGQSAFPASPGQTEVAIDVTPLDPARLAPPPAGMLAAGNAYRIRASYLPSRRQIGTVDGELNLGLVYPLLAVPVADPAGHVVLHSPDGRSWKQLASVDVPGTHQVTAQLAAPGYVLAAVPAGSAPSESLAKRALRQAPLVAGVVLLLMAAAFFFRRRGAGRRVEDDDTAAEDLEDGGEDGGGRR